LTQTLDCSDEDNRRIERFVTGIHHDEDIRRTDTQADDGGPKRPKRSFAKAKGGYKNENMLGVFLSAVGLTHDDRCKKCLCCAANAAVVAAAVPKGRVGWLHRVLVA